MKMKLTEYFRHWEQVRSELLSTLDKFSTNELDYKPYGEAWTVREICLHIADAEDGWLRYIVRQEIDDWPPEPDSGAYPCIESLKRLLNEVHDQTVAYLGGLEIEDLSRQIDAPWGAKLELGWIIWHVLEHEIHHRGELSLILGLLGREGLDV